MIEAFGTALAAIYALKGLGVGTVYLYNSQRTEKKAEELLGQAFGADNTSEVVSDLEGLAKETGTTSSPPRLLPMIIPLSQLELTYPNSPLMTEMERPLSLIWRTNLRKGHLHNWSRNVDCVIGRGT